MRAVYASVGGLIILLGLVHFAAAFLIFDAFNSRAVWFASGGIAIVLAGLLNLLNRAYGAGAPGVRWAAIGANVAMTGLALAAGIAGAASGVQLVVIAGLMVAATGLSLQPRFG